MIEYPKIYGPFERHTEGPNKNRLIFGQWSQPEFADLAYVNWEWTEKVDGTSIQVRWDGHRVEYGGRTENAQIPAKLISWLDDNFTEELFEQKFGSDSVTLFGEGYGAGIQSGGNYSPDQRFVLFDVLIGDWWLLRENVEDIAKAFGIDVVPIVLTGTVTEAIERVQSGNLSSWGDFEAEGLVGRIPSGLRTRKGDRVMMKVKRKDFPAERVIGNISDEGEA